MTAVYNNNEEFVSALSGVLNADMADATDRARVNELVFRVSTYAKFSADGMASSATSETPAIYPNCALVGDGVLHAVVFSPLSGGLTANDTNYANFVLRINGQVFATLTTKTLAGGGSGDWVQNVPVTLSVGSLVPATTVTAGSVSTIQITKSGSGVIVPSGTLRLIWRPS